MSRSLRAVLAMGVLGAVVAGFAPLGASAAITDPVVGWSNEFGTSTYDQAQAVVANAKGEVFVVGQTDGTMYTTNNAGGYDGFVAKLDAVGRIQWITQFGGPGSDIPLSIAIAANGDLVVAGYTNGALTPGSAVGLQDAFVLKLNKAGKVQWTKQFGTAQNDFGTGLALGKDGSVYVGGYTDGAMTAAPSHGGVDSFVAKFDKKGKPVWTTQAGTDQDDIARAIAVSTKGDVYLGGETKGTFANNSTNAGASDAFVLHLDKTGTVTLAKQFGELHEDVVSALAVTSKGEVRVVGLTYGNLFGTNAGSWDVFAFQMLPNGTTGWTLQFGSNGYDDPKSAVVGSDGSLYIGGGESGSLAPGVKLGGFMDGFVTKVSKAGVVVSVRQLGTSGDDRLFGVALRKTGANGGQVVAVGTTDGVLFGNTRSGSYDAWVSALSM